MRVRVGGWEVRKKKGGTARRKQNKQNTRLCQGRLPRLSPQIHTNTLLTLNCASVSCSSATYSTAAAAANSPSTSPVASEEAGANAGDGAASSLSARSMLRYRRRSSMRSSRRATRASHAATAAAAAVSTSTEGGADDGAVASMIIRTPRLVAGITRGWRVEDGPRPACRCASRANATGDADRAPSGRAAACATTRERPLRRAGGPATGRGDGCARGARGLAPTAPVRMRVTVCWGGRQVRGGACRTGGELSACVARATARETKRKKQQQKTGDVARRRESCDRRRTQAGENAAVTFSGEKNIALSPLRLAPLPFPRHHCTLVLSHAVWC